MRIAFGTRLVATLLTVFLIIGAVTPLAAQDKCLHVKHEIATSGLPLIGTVVVYNSQDIKGDNYCRNTRSSKISLGDTVISDVEFSTIIDMPAKKMIIINPREKTFTEKEFLPSEFAIIDSAADARGPQMEIKETGNTKVIDGLNCRELYFKLDRSQSTGVGDARLKHFFEGTLWYTMDIPNADVYASYNSHSHEFTRGSDYNPGGFFDILDRLDVDPYNLLRLIKSIKGVPVEASFVAQLPSDTGGNVFETKIKLMEHSDKAFAKGYFSAPAETFERMPFKQFKAY